MFNAAEMTQPSARLLEVRDTAQHPLGTNFKKQRGTGTLILVPLIDLKFLSLLQVMQELQIGGTKAYVNSCYGVMFRLAVR
jgi:hypothetical protein